MEKFDAPYSDQVRNRREKLAQLQAEGMDPYAQTKFIFDSNSAQIKENFDQMEGKPVSLALREVAEGKCVPQAEDEE